MKNRLNLWPTDLNINRDHLLIEDYLPTKFEDSGAKRSWVAEGVGDWYDLWPWPLTYWTEYHISYHLLVKNCLHVPTKFRARGTKHSWVISCTRCWRSTWHLTLTFDLLTWISIGIIYSSRTIYLPSLKLLGQSLLSYQGVGDWHDLWPTVLTWISIGIYSLRTIYLPSLKLGRKVLSTDGSTCRHVQRNVPSFFEKGHKRKQKRTDKRTETQRRTGKKTIAPLPVSLYACNVLVYGTASYCNSFT